MTQEHPDISTSVKQRQKLIRAAVMHWVHWLVVTLSILLTIGAWYFSKKQIDEKIAERFDREADRVVELVKERMELYENALWGGVALFDASEEVTYPEWATYARSLHIDKTYPGINGIGVIFNIQPNDLEAYFARERQWRPDYDIHPKHDESEHWPITYIEPAKQNYKAIGLDMAFEANRYTAIKKARDTGHAQVTGPIILVQDAKKTPGFLFYTPFYENGHKPETVQQRREHIVGVTYAPFTVAKLMRGTLAKRNRHIKLKICDGNELLYEDSEDDGSVDIGNQPRFSKSVTVDMYGRLWRFDLGSDLNFEAAASSNQPYMILAGGIMIDTLLFTLFILLTRANRRALSYADQVTKDLQIKSEHLEKTNQDLDEFAYVASHDLRSPLEGIKKLASWVSEDNAELLSDQSKRHLKQMLQRIGRLENLLDDLLQYSRAGRVDHQTLSVDTGQLARDIAELGDRPKEFTVSVASDMPILVTAKTPLEQILRNLISNAIKHHNRVDGTVKVSYQPNGRFVEFEVSDDGPGIDRQFHEQIFKMFTTLKPRDDVEGSGMGLAIIKKLVERYGGKITVQSDHNRGTTFRFTWPKTMNGDA